MKVKHLVFAIAHIAAIIMIFTIDFERLNEVHQDGDFETVILPTAFLIVVATLDIYHLAIYANKNWERRLFNN